MTILAIIAAVGAASTALLFNVFYKKYPPQDSEMLYIPLPQAPVSSPEASEPLNPISMPTDPIDTLLPWTDQKSYYHNVGVLCDLSELTFSQKDTVRRCIYIESRFRDYDSDGNPIRGFNKDKTGTVWSIDWGLVQINDWPKFKHIGPGCMFSSVQDVLSNPQRSAQYMIDTMKSTGRLQPWASYTSGAYLDVPTTALDVLKT